MNICQAASRYVSVVVVLLLIVVAGGNDAISSLALTKLSDLISSSGVIVRGRVVRSEVIAPRGGTSTVEVEEVYRGKIASKTFSISWGKEVEDQSLDRVGEERLFFLRRDPSGTFHGTHYGRSYWPLVQDYDNHRIVTPYLGRLTYLDLDISGLIVKTKIRVLDVPEEANPVTVDTIPLDLLIPVFAKEREVK